MDKVTEIRKEADKLEEKISALLKEFVEKNGNCDISLSSRLVYEHTHLGHKKDLVSVSVDVNVNI